jgi:hypothetical protein
LRQQSNHGRRGRKYYDIWIIRLFLLLRRFRLKRLAIHAGILLDQHAGKAAGLKPHYSAAIRMILIPSDVEVRAVSAVDGLMLVFF